MFFQYDTVPNQHFASARFSPPVNRRCINRHVMATKRHLQEVSEILAVKANILDIYLVYLVKAGLLIYSARYFLYFSKTTIHETRPDKHL